MKGVRDQVVKVWRIREIYIVIQIFSHSIILWSLVRLVVEFSLGYFIQIFSSID